MKKLRTLLAVILTLSMLIPMFAITSSAASYTVAFDANGGTGGPGITTVSSGSSVPSSAPKKDGMTFRGWATSKENAGKGVVAYSYNAQYGGSSKLNISGNTVLYAVWAYTVTLNPGYEGWASSGNKVLYKYPDVPLALAHTKATIYNSYRFLPGKTGVTSEPRTFILWSTEQDKTTSKGIGDNYVEEYTANENATLYCIWGFRIQYYADGGIFPSTGTDTFLTYVCAYDGANYQNPKTLYGNFDFPMEDNAPVKEGCHLKAQNNGDPFFMLLWADMRPFTTETPGNNLTIPPYPWTGSNGYNWSAFHTVTCATGDIAIEFYACWEPDVTYKANGGEGEDVVDTLHFDWAGLHVYDSYQIMTATDACYQFSRQGYSFCGWNTKADGTGTSYTPGMVISNLGNSDPITLYAQWERTGYVNLSFDGVLAADNVPGTISVEKGTAVTLPTNCPSYSGWSFVGWNESGNGMYQYYQPGEKIVITKETTLKAVWSQSAYDGYAVFFDANGGLFGGNLTKYARPLTRIGLLKYGEAFNFPDTSKLSREGYRLHTSDTDFTKVAFFSDNGTNKAVTSNGYGTAIYSEYAFPLTSDVVPYGTNIYLYACWDPIVTYDMNNGSNAKINDFARATEANNYTVLGLGDYTKYSSSSTANGSRTADVYNTLIENREGYSGLRKIPSLVGDKELVSWNTKADGTGTTYNVGEKYDITEPITLYAQWQEIHTHSYTNKITTPATCTTKGVRTYTCSCGDTYTEEIPALNHDYKSTVVAPTCLEDGYTSYQCSRCTSNYTDTPVNSLGHLWTNWYTVTPATATQDGLESRVCTRDGCTAFEEKVIPATGGEIESEVYAENYTLTITNASTVNAVRFAKGTYTTASEIKSAEGVVSLSESVIKANLVNGDLKYELPDGGVYSVWYKYADGTQKIVNGIDATYMTQTVISDGLKVTVNNLYGVKDFFIAKGTHTTYRSIKNTAGYINVTSAKFGSAHSYTHGVAVGDPGEYTCLVRYNDSERADEYIYFTCEVTTPEITTDGRQITIGNLDGVKVVRIAQGTYSTVAEIKAAPGALGYSAATIAKLADKDGNFVLRKNATEEGTAYTVAVVYDNFYQEVHQITLKKKVPAYTVNGNSVTFTNLDGFTMVRYAPGKYTTGAGIKAATGVKTIKSSDVSGTEVKISNLSGKYSFLVQYYEESQNFIVIDF